MLDAVDRVRQDKQPQRRNQIDAAAQHATFGDVITDSSAVALHVAARVTLPQLIVHVDGFGCAAVRAIVHVAQIQIWTLAKHVAQRLFFSVGAVGELNAAQSSRIFLRCTLYTNVAEPVLLVHNISMKHCQRQVRRRIEERAHTLSVRMNDLTPKTSVSPSPLKLRENVRMQTMGAPSPGAPDFIVRRVTAE